MAGNSRAAGACPVGNVNPLFSYRFGNPNTGKECVSTYPGSRAVVLSALWKVVQFKSKRVQSCPLPSVAANRCRESCTQASLTKAAFSLFLPKLKKGLYEQFFFKAWRRLPSQVLRQWSWSTPSALAERFGLACTYSPGPASTCLWQEDASWLQT